MLPEDEVKVESFRLAAGGISLHLTHVPTGRSVYGEPSDETYLTRLAELHEQLELLVNKDQTENVPAVHSARAEFKIASLVPLTDDSPFHSSAEVSKRISGAFPTAEIDIELANRLLQVELRALEAVRTPSPILQGHKNLFGRTTCVRVYSPEGERLLVHFMVYPDSPINVFSVDAGLSQKWVDAIRSLVSKIATVLDYEVEFNS